MQIPSVNPPQFVETSGFDLTDEVAQMVGWLGRGPDVSRFVTHDVENELYRQTPGAQLLDLTLRAEPALKTTATQSDSGGTAIVSALDVTFPLAVRVRAVDGVVWNLEVNLGYAAFDMDAGTGRRKLRLSFNIVGHRHER